MAITVANAKTYVARILGGSASSEILAMANEAILRAYADMQNRKFWRFLLKDTSLGFSVSGVSLAAGTTITAPSSGAFDGINVGVTITTTSGTITIPASTTVSAITRGSDGTVSSITLSAAMSGTTDSNATITVSGDIPIVAGTRDYNVPTDFQAPFTAMLLVNKRVLTYRDHRTWDRVIPDQTVRGLATDYTLYNKYSELSQNFGTQTLRLDRIPDSSDTLHLKYYRKFNTTGTNIDWPDDSVYEFLDYAAGLLLARKAAQEDPEGFLKSAVNAIDSLDQSDEEPTDDNDDDMRMKSQFEMGNQNRPLWGNGQFDPMGW